MPTTEFRPEVHGFTFANRFVNDVARLPTGDRIKTTGRCGGMAAGALDIFFAGRSAPTDDWSTFPRGVPPDATPLATYLSKRQLDSFANTSAVRFVVWTLMPSGRTLMFKGVDGWTKEEVAEICRSIDQGTPCVVGLVGASSLGDVGRRNHQAVAFGYRRARGEVRLDLYDSNSPGRTVELTWRRDESGLVASNRRTPWRGAFLHTHDAEVPPEAIWKRRSTRVRSTG